MQKSYYSETTFKDAEDFKRLDFIISMITNTHAPDSKILDIGCGNGNIALALGSIGYHVLGIDIDAESIIKAQTKNRFSNVRFEQTDANALLVQDEFDVVICSEVLEHLEHPGKLILSIYRILRRDGILIATVPNGIGPREVVVTRPVLWLQRKGAYGTLLGIKKSLGYSNTTVQSSNPDLTHIQFFSVKRFKKLLQTSGFIINQWKNANFIEKIFPLSLLTRRIHFLQKIDCWFANYIPKNLSSGFYTTWKKGPTAQ